MNIQIPTGYYPILSIRDTQIAIKLLKNYFQDALEEKLSLMRVSAPMLVFSDSGLNDGLSSPEQPVLFDVPNIGRKVEIVYSLAKWKRYALDQYGFKIGEGLFTDMNAVRPEEELDNIHSIYVDQWDWERIIMREERSIETLVQTAKRLYDILKELERKIVERFPKLECYLPKNFKVISTQELIDAYPGLSEKEREYEISRKYKAVFLTQIGDVANNGEKHGARAPDYDDWTMNGDLILYYPVLDCAMEITSMGVRVDADSLRSQAQKAGCKEILELPYHRAVLDELLPYTIGGGLGQSRICMFLLNKAHIGEVHVSPWSQETMDACVRAGIPLL